MRPGTREFTAAFYLLDADAPPRMWIRSMICMSKMAEDDAFQPRSYRHLAHTPLSADPDWTCRVLVGGLKPARVYWYRFTDDDGNGSRVGRTITAPPTNDPRPVTFAFVCCQNANHGAQNAYRRMIYEDERAAAEERLGFVLHLGDFIYELVWYPEDRPQGHVRPPPSRHRALCARREDPRLPYSDHVDDYRAVYRAYLHDPDLQDARARWPFVAMWDNHEFCWQGWQTLQNFGRQDPAGADAQSRRQSGLVRISAGARDEAERASLRTLRSAARVERAHHALRRARARAGAEQSRPPSAASRGYRALRWGRHVD